MRASVGAPQHYLCAQDFEVSFLDQVHDLTRVLEQKRWDNCLNGKEVDIAFFGPSTRTSISFEKAVKRLGGVCTVRDSAQVISSAAKGESLRDMGLIYAGYDADAIVLRHTDDDGADRLAKALMEMNLSTVVVNAGCGKEQHPTQAALDDYTLRREFGRIAGLKIAFVGDNKYSRTVRSLIYLLGKYPEVTIYLVNHPDLEIREGMKQYLDRHGVKYHETPDLLSVLGIVDAIYVTRPQKEHFEDPTLYDRVKDCYVITGELVDKYMHPDARILHPLPRNGEITEDVDHRPQAAYFRQARYGLYVRMALLMLRLGRNQ